MFPDPVAGDILFNLSQPLIQPVGAEDDPIVEIGNDLENLFLHELGHGGMGLAHPPAGPGEVMFVGFADFGGGDLGCEDPGYPTESPQCQDGTDNDGTIGTDFDGGQSILGVGNGDPNGADPNCSSFPDDREAANPVFCGLGPELAVLAPVLEALRRRRQQGE